MGATGLPEAYAYAVAGLLTVAWLLFVATWKDYFAPVVLLIFISSSVASGVALLREGKQEYFEFGLANVLYVANFLLFPLGARRWQLELTNIAVWVLLGSSFLG